jgi:hypothetical protein
MRRLLLITAATVLFGCSTSLAQVAGSYGAPAPQVMTPPVGSPGTALGAIHPNLASPLANNSAGSISQCTVSGAGTASNFAVDTTDVTASATPGFNASEASAGCGAASSPPATPGLVSGSDFSDGAVPLGSTEAGGSGLSPLIAGPFPQPPTTTCSGDTTTSELTSDPLSSGC